MRTLCLVLLVLALSGVAKVVSAAPATVEHGWHGNYFPNVELTTHDGKKVRFAKRSGEVIPEKK